MDTDEQLLRSLQGLFGLRFTLPTDLTSKRWKR